MPLSIASNNEQQVPVTASPVTSSGKPAQVDGPLRITVVSGTATFTQDPATPLVFKAVSGNDPGTTEYLVEADADLGAGEVLIQDTVTYEVEGAQAASFGLASGVPEPKPEPTPVKGKRK
jgi:hypothetical protein